MGRYKLGDTAKNIFRYDNFRDFLRDYFNEQKNIRRVFSQRFFAQRAGFSSHNFCALVVKGQRNLSGDSLEKIIKAIPLKGEASEYFRTLVKFNQTDDQETKRELINYLNTLRERTRFEKLDQKAYPFFNKWYYPVIRVLAAYSSWNGDFHKLARMVKPPITTDEARSAVLELVQMGLLVDAGNGCYTVSSRKISSLDIPPIVRRRNRRELLLQCMYNSEDITPDKRYLAYTTLGTTEKTYKKIVEYLDSVRQNVIDMVMSDEQIEKVYELVFNVVPVSELFKQNREGAACDE